VSAPGVVVVGGGLAGITAALDCADAGMQVTLVERRRDLGGATRSFRRNGTWIDNGQHVFLRCCTEYRALLERFGVTDLVSMQYRLDIPVLRPGHQPARLRRSALPAPLHLVGALARYSHLAVRDRMRALWAGLSLRALDRDDPSLDDLTFGAWLDAHGQSADAVHRLWDLVCVPTVNLPAAEASLALAAKVFRTGLLDDADAADIGWARVPLRALHGDPARQALARVGVAIVDDTTIAAIRPRGARFDVEAPGRTWSADAVVLAVPHEAAARLVPTGAGVDPTDLLRLGRSPIIDVHVVFDRRVTDLEFAAAVESPVQFVFDRTDSAGMTSGQYLAVSVSAAETQLGDQPAVLVDRYVEALRALFPVAKSADVRDAVVTREHAATFRGVPGTCPLRPGPRTAIPGFVLAGAWTDTGWPATMEGAVRSGHAAAREVLRVSGGHRVLEEPEEIVA
jgi:hydroxysqualene dehydroxylase